MAWMLKRAAWVLLLGGCTPLGLWIYEDPVVSVHRVTLRLGNPGAVEASPVIVALVVENRNDFPLSTERVELSLRMDGVPIGRLAHDNPVSVPTDTISMVAMPLELEKRTTRQQIEALGSGTHLFAVRGRARFRTPIGVREVRFAQAGSMVFGQRARPASR
jgi:LEA14-like dessication related protein